MSDGLCPLWSGLSLVSSSGVPVSEVVTSVVSEEVRLVEPVRRQLQGVLASNVSLVESMPNCSHCPVVGIYSQLENRL